MGLDLVIGNSGATVATNARVDIQPPSPLTVIQHEDTEAALAHLRDSGIQALPPSRELRWAIGDGGSIYSSSDNHRHTFVIRADGPFGPVPELVYDIDFEDFITANAELVG
jgi:hypothetical protein